MTTETHDAIGDFDPADAADDRTIADLLSDPDTDWDAVRRLGNQMEAIERLAETDPAAAKRVAKAWAAELGGSGG